MGTRRRGPGTSEGQAAAFARGMGLPSSFSDLEISGLDRIPSARDLTERNREMIFRFLNHISPEVSERRLTFYTHKLRRLGGWLGKDFDLVTEDDLRSLMTFLSKGRASTDGRRFAGGTVHGYKVTIKRFYRWLEGHDEEYPHKVRWIKSNGDETRIKSPEQLLTFEEILAMAGHARNPRDKAMVSFLYESGARVSEMLSMKIKDLEFSSAVVKATLPVSKTMPRVIPLVSCRQHLATWVNYHPLKEDSDAPLWSNLKRRGNDPLLSQTVSVILKAIAAEAGIKKRVYPHLFRACSITHKQAVGWPEQAIKAFHGLSKDSKVMKHYSHLSYNNLEQIQRKMNGLPADSATSGRGVKCPGCGKFNALFVEVCECGLPTEMKTAPRSREALESEIEARLEKKLEEFIESRLGYDRFMEQFMRLLLERSRRSPSLLKAVSEVRSTLQDHSLTPGLGNSRRNGG